VSDAFWRETLHADPHVLGTTVKVGTRPVTIVGVMPAGFAFPQYAQGAVLYTPRLVDASGKDEHGFNSASVAVRLKPGVAPDAALAELRAIFAHSGKPGDKSHGTLTWRPYKESVTGDERPALLMLLGACGLLLAIACVNSANLQIARGAARTGEMQVRSALGAGRARLLQQIVTESVTVSAIGAGLGLGLAWALLRWASSSYGERFPRFDELALHPAAFAGCALVAVAVGVLAAVAPALGVLRSTGVRAAAQARPVTRRSRLTGALVAVEIALTCVLLTTAGLLLRTFRALEQQPLGFDPHHLVEITLMPVNPKMDGAALQQTYTRLLDRLNGLPGVEAATTQTALPFSDFGIEMESVLRIVGRPIKPNDAVAISLIDAGYSRAMGVPVLEGRGFTPSDGAGTQPVCLVNQAFVREHFGGHAALGSAVEFVNEAKDGSDGRLIKASMTIVGVIPDMVAGSNLAYQPWPVLLLDYKQVPAGAGELRFMMGLAPQFAVRSSLPLETLQTEIRAALKQSAPEMAEMRIAPVDTSIAASLANQRLALWLAGGFGVVALLLASVGLYGVLAYAVAQRTREIGIRMALGSSREQAMRLVMTQAAGMVALGLALGCAGSWPAGRAVRALLFGVHALDPLTLVLVAVALLAVCAVAAAVPARRAASVDPMQALRSE
jgi:predicted permease